LRTECRRAFRTLLEKAGFTGRMPRIVACGGRGAAYRDFCTSLTSSCERPFLLVDSEEPVCSESPWAHLQQGDGWKRPSGATEDHCHLMVQCMETWFLADVPALSAFYGKGFAPNALPANKNLEAVSKRDVFDALEKATRDTRTKGPYGKTTHSFRILNEIDPGKVRKVSKWADRFFATLDRML